VRRLPDTPEKIARGIAAGVATSFTPFFGLHFFIAFILARLGRGNALASVMATFFGNPLTYFPIAFTSLWCGYQMMGVRMPRDIVKRFFDQITVAWADIWHNIKAIFTPERAEWAGLKIFYDDYFFPFMIGSIAPGIIAGAICYYLSVPVIAAYQKRRRNKLQAKLQQLGKKR